MLLVETEARLVAMCHFLKWNVVVDPHAHRKASSNQVKPKGNYHQWWNWPWKSNTATRMCLLAFQASIPSIFTRPFHAKHARMVAFGSTKATHTVVLVARHQIAFLKCKHGGTNTRGMLDITLASCLCNV